MSSIFKSDCVYIATSEEGFKFRLVFTEDNNVDYEYDPCYAGYTGYECSDDEYVRYVYYCESDCLSGRLYTKYADGDEFEVDVSLEEEHLPLFVDCNNNLFIKHSVLGEVEWVEIADKEVLSEICCDDNSSINCSIEVLGIKMLKTTGNYRVKMDVSGSLYPGSVCWNVLLSPDGKILKKCRV